MSRIFSVQFTPGQDQEFISGGWDDTVQVLHCITILLYFVKSGKRLPRENP